MRYDLDSRALCASMLELLHFDLPFTTIMPDEFEYNSDNVRFIYSDLGISGDKLRKLLDLKVVRDGIERKFSLVTVEATPTGEYEFPNGDIEYEPTEGASEIIRKRTVVVFE